MQALISLGWVSWLHEELNVGSHVPVPNAGFWPAADDDAVQGVPRSQTPILKKGSLTLNCIPYRPAQMRALNFFRNFRNFLRHLLICHALCCSGICRPCWDLLDLHSQVRCVLLCKSNQINRSHFIVYNGRSGVRLVSEKYRFSPLKIVRICGGVSLSVMVCGGESDSGSKGR